MAVTAFSPHHGPARRALFLAAILVLVAGGVVPAQGISGDATPPARPAGDENAASFTPPAPADFTRREVMIPMRDGARLFTVIILPKGAKRAPILLTRTPYNAQARGQKTVSLSLSATVGDSDYADELMVNDGYIRVFQDIRGRSRSDGSFLMNRPLSGPLNPETTDESTDAYDTIDWLVKHVPESNGRVAITGISYDGYESLMALVNPHPALRAAVPINPMVDGWLGDDWFHHGAFRQTGTVPFTYEAQTSRSWDLTWPASVYDQYSFWLNGVSAGAVAAAYGVDQLGFWRKISQHPAYDSFWQAQAVDKVLGARKLSVPTMLVHSLWDQEDIYGAPAVYAALRGKPEADGKLFFVMGPWFHHQQRLRGDRIGAIEFGQDSAAYFRRNLLRPFLNKYLFDTTKPADIAPVTAFETGTNVWRKLHSWPPAAPAAGQTLYLRHDLTLAPSPGTDAAATSYIADPAHPVPYIPRPVREGDAGEDDWQSWLVSDQRHAEARPDVLTYRGPVLTSPLRLAGQPIANITARLSRQDADFVVKIIDEYPPLMGRDPALGGYQLMISADILRGRYRHDLARPQPAVPGASETFRFSLPNLNHVLLPGHRLMVQIQSSWFPLYDRNPQKWVDNIFFARAEDFLAQTISVIDGGKEASYVQLPILPQAVP